MEITKENMLAAMMRMCETNPYEFTERTHRNDNVETVILNTFYSERETIRLQLARLFESDRFKVHITENQSARRDDKDAQRGYSGYGGAAVYRSKGFHVDKLNLVVIESQASFTVSLLDERYAKLRRLFPFCKKTYVETDAFKAFRELTHGDRFDNIEKYIGCDFVLRTYNSCTFTYRKYFVSTDYACEQITSKEYNDIIKTANDSKQKKIESVLDKCTK